MVNYFINMTEQIVKFFLENWFQILTLLFQVLIAIGAIYFAWRQTTINKRLKDLQDIVAISFIIDYLQIPGQEKSSQPISVFKFLNVGKINIYIHKLQIPEMNIIKEISKPRLIPAVGSDVSFYSYPIPKNMPNGDFRIILKITDEFDKEYISEHGGNFDNGFIQTWSYKTYAKKWSTQ